MSRSASGATARMELSSYQSSLSRMSYAPSPAEVSGTFHLARIALTLLMQVHQRPLLGALHRLRLRWLHPSRTVLGAQRRPLLRSAAAAPQPRLPADSPHALAAQKSCLPLTRCRISLSDLWLLTYVCSLTPRARCSASPHRSAWTLTPLTHLVGSRQR
jgi:hypothetical protein